MPDPASGGRVPIVKTWLDAWPVYRQLTGNDPLGRGKAARSKATENLTSRTATADRVVQSVCPYCSVGCAQRVFVKDEKIVQIEGDPEQHPGATVGGAEVADRKKRLAHDGLRRACASPR